MTCPECGNAIVLQRTLAEVEGLSVLYHVSCNRCQAHLGVIITIVKHGQPELVKQTREWLAEGRKGQQ